MHPREINKQTDKWTGSGAVSTLTDQTNKKTDQGLKGLCWKLELADACKALSPGQGTVPLAPSLTKQTNKQIKA